MTDKRLVVGDRVIMYQDWYDQWPKGVSRVGRKGVIVGITSSRYIVMWDPHTPINHHDEVSVNLLFNKFFPYFRYESQAIPKYDKNKRFTLLITEE